MIDVLIAGKVFGQPKDGARQTLDMVAHGVLTAYQVSRKRKAMQGEQQETAKYDPNNDLIHRKLGDANI